MPLSMFFTCAFCVVKPYNESRDNWIAILSSALLFLVFLSSSFMKYNQLLAEESEAYDLVGMGILLIIAYGSVIVLFLWWAYHQKDVMSTSTVTMAKNTLSGMSSIGGSSLGEEEEEKQKEKEVNPHLARAESFKKEFKAKGGLKGKGVGAGRGAKKAKKVKGEEGGGSLEMSDIKVTDDDEQQEQESSLNPITTKSLEGRL
ncbi:hypothetical protein TrLO_g6522 [Triparma laevis f. longispina]|nr:hypothetical protein TrLO_g6522 [Triparma laevis f. longispina]